MPTDDYPGFEWLRRNWDELAPFNFQWVAVDGNQLIANGRDLAEVIRTVIRQGVQSKAVYAYIDFPEVENGIRYGRF